MIKNNFFIEISGLDCIQNDLVPCVKQLNNMTQRICPEPFPKKNAMERNKP